MPTQTPEEEKQAIYNHEADGTLKSVAWCLIWFEVWSGDSQA